MSAILKNEDPAARRAEFYGRLDTQSLAPLWERLKGLVPTEPKPSRYFVAAVRSNSRPPTYGPRSMTRARTTRDPWRSTTVDPHGSDLCATPSRPGVRVPPQPVGRP